LICKITELRNADHGLAEEYNRKMEGNKELAEF
jgi:hypothetical protein